MKQNKLGSSDLFVSQIGLGTMSLGKEKTEAVKIIHRALEKGSTLIDTADLYGFGQNEGFVGKALKGKREQCVLATKVGNRWDHLEKGWEWAPSRAYIKGALKKSLQRLGTDYIDLYQLHGGTMEDPIDEIIATFEELKTEGLIREYGISSIRPNVIREYLTRSNLVSIMMQYSLLDRRPEEWLDTITNHGVSIIARGPLAKGYLSERTLANPAAHHSYLTYSYQEIQELMKKMKGISKSRKLTHMSLRYVLNTPTVATVIPGASTIEQVESNIDAAAVPLTKDEVDLLQQWTKEDRYQKHR